MSSVCLCGIIKDNQVILFLGNSGSGKTTIARLSKKYIILSDEMVAIRKIKDDFFAFATPWWGRDSKRPKKINKEITGKISQVFFLKKDREIFFKDMTLAEAIIKIIGDKLSFKRSLNFQGREDVFYLTIDLLKKVHLGEMHFFRDVSFWHYLTIRR